jgi:hypothetical protein
MEFYSPLDYNAGLDQAKQLFPDYAAQDAQRRELAVQEGTLALNQQKQNQTLANQQHFGTTLAALPHDFTSDQWQQFLADNPGMQTQADAFYKTVDAQRRSDDAHRMGLVYSALNAGNYNLAGQLVQQHIDGDKTGGRDPDPWDQSMLADITSGDATRQQNALKTSRVALALTDPAKFGETFGALDKGTQPILRQEGPDLVSYDPVTGKTTKVYTQRLFNVGQGGAIAPDDAGPADQTAPPATAPGATPPAAAPAATPPANVATGRITPAPKPGQYVPAEQAGGDLGFGAAFANLWPHEKGYNPKDLNGFPSANGINLKWYPPAVLAKYGVTDPKQMTQDQAAAIYRNEIWPQSGAANLPPNMQAPYFDAYIRAPEFTKAALIRSQGDPSKFMDLVQAHFQGNLAGAGANVDRAWAGRDADNRAIATGQPAPGAVATTPGGVPVMHTGGGNIATPGGGDSGIPPAPAGFHWAIPPKQPAGGTPVQATPALIEEMAQRAAAGEKWSDITAGRGTMSNPTIMAAMNRRAEIDGTKGLTGADIGIQQNFYQNNIANAKNLAKNLGILQASERNFGGVAQQALDAANAISEDTQYPLFNVAVNQALRQSGDPRIARLDTALRSAATEYARLITANANGGGGGVTDSARNDYMTLMSPNASIAQKRASLQQMITDGHIRVSSYQNILNDTYKHMHDRAPGLPGSATGPLLPGIPAGSKWAGTVNGVPTYRTPKGQLVQAGQ